MTIIHMLAGGRVIVLPPGRTATIGEDDLIRQSLIVTHLGKITDTCEIPFHVKKGQILSGTERLP